jgi:hypothetical protein
MIESLVIGITGIVSMMLLWVIVQSLWRNIFPDQLIDDDVLAGRTSCSNCGCTTVCKNRAKNPSPIE